MKEKFYNRLASLVSADCVQIDENLAKYTTFKIGGPADYLVTVQDANTLSKVISLCNEFEMPYFMLGKGSNLLVSDQGYRGVVIRLASGKGFEQLDAADEKTQQLVSQYGLDTNEVAIYRCQAGVSLIAFAMEVCRSGFTGFEFATGIPGSLGGAVAMNAGAYGGDMSQVIVEATVVDLDGTQKVYSKEELQMGYRKSIIQQSHSIVTEAIFAFHKGQAEEIMAKVKELGSLRIQKQPLEYPSAGSTFKRPGENCYVGKMVMDAGLRGYQIGGAQVSEKHCGFVINAGGATAADVIALVKYIQEVIKVKYDKDLEMEVKLLGDFDMI